MKRTNPQPIAALGLLLFASTAAADFSFDSTSSGADGALSLSDSDCSEADTAVEVDVGSSGIKQYSSISIHENCLVTFTPSGGGSGSYSAPVRLVVSGDVVINGTLNLDGQPGVDYNSSSQVPGGKGGPGGFDGGHSATYSASDTHGAAGYGPGGGGGGTVNGNYNSTGGSGGSLTPTEDDPRLQPLVGGSGGGGGGYRYNNSNFYPGSGGGGGGAIQIASSATITLGGEITALGGAKGSGSAYSYGGAGANGMIHLIANKIQGSGTLNAGIALVETLDNRVRFGGTGIQFIELQQLALDLDNSAQSLRITEIGGSSVTPGTGLALDADGEVSVVIDSTGLAENTEVTVAVSAGGSDTVSKVTTGIDASGDASATVTLSPGVSLVIAYVSGVITQQSAALLPRYLGEQIQSARLETTAGSNTQLVLYTESGKRVPEGFVENPKQYVTF